MPATESKLTGISADGGENGAHLPLVSILIPCYNAERYIGHCIRSALDQAYPNKEVLVMDDGSTDSSRRIIEAFGDRVQVYSGPRAGANAARNRLTALASGEWLQYLDADDYLLPDKIGSQIQLVQERRCEVDVVYSPMICHNVYRPEADYTTEIRSDDATVNYIRWEPFNTIGMLLRREVVLSTGGWKEDQPCCQEHELLLRLMMKGTRFLACRTPGAVAQFHGSDSVSRANPLRVIRARMELTDRAGAFLESTRGLTPACRKALFVARMESARDAYKQDEPFAEKLYRKALAGGAAWTLSSAALPLRYQLALRVLGFARTERIAARRRERKARTPEPVDGPGTVRSTTVEELGTQLDATPASLPLVSIVIPCYNAEAWIGHAIRSALEQDYPNKEVIVLDDGSTDASRQIIEAFGDRIQFLPGRHAGGNAARNQLTARARGEWVQYLDADDYLLTSKLSSQLQALDHRQETIDVVYSPVICHNAGRPGAATRTSIGMGNAALHFIQWSPYQTTGMLLRREAVLKVGGWKEDQPCCQEHELLLRLLKAGSCFLPAKEPGAVYRFHGEGSVSRRDPLRVIRIRMELTDLAAEYLEHAGQLTAEHRRALFVARMESARTAYRWEPQYAKQLYRKAMDVGQYWLNSSSALPIRYQLALRTIGFDRAQQLAAWRRRIFDWRSTPPQPQ